MLNYSLPDIVMDFDYCEFLLYLYQPPESGLCSIFTWATVQDPSPDPLPPQYCCRYHPHHPRMSEAIPLAYFRIWYQKNCWEAILYFLSFWRNISANILTTEFTWGKSKSPEFCNFCVKQFMQISFFGLILAPLLTLAICCSSIPKAEWDAKK